MQRLFDSLSKIDGKPYGRFRDIQGSYDNGDYTIHIDRVQGSPTSEPTAMRITMSIRSSGFPDDTLTEGPRRVALGDLIARRFWESSRTHSKSISFPRPGQEILERGSITITGSSISASFGLALPAAGKNAAGKKTVDMIASIDTIVRESLFFHAYKRSKLYNHIETNENGNYVRSQLKERGMKAFISNGAVLPRREDGIAPMRDAIPFQTSDVMTMDVPNGEPWEGLGIPDGFTAIIGPVFSGRSTLIDALAAGVHNHIPGDGREGVITVGDATQIFKEDRPVHDVDISMFSEKKITTETVSGPLAEFAAISEAMGSGCSLLLMDEDTISPSVLCADPKVRELTGDPTIPITEAPLGEMSVIVATDRDVVMERADNVLLMDGMRIERKTERPRTAVTVGERNPLVRDDAAVACVCANVSDVSYERSVVAAVKALWEDMDGTTSISKISEKGQRLSPGTVKVRKEDIVAAMNRCAGISFISKRNN